MVFYFYCGFLLFCFLLHDIALLTFFSDCPNFSNNDQTADESFLLGVSLDLKPGFKAINIISLKAFETKLIYILSLWILEYYKNEFHDSNF